MIDIFKFLNAEISIEEIEKFIAGRPNAESFGQRVRNFKKGR